MMRKPPPASPAAQAAPTQVTADDVAQRKATLSKWAVGAPTDQSSVSRSNNGGGGASSAEPYGQWDILCGRGGKVNRHSGNRVYRRLIDAKKPLYRKLTKKDEKNVLLTSMLQALKKQGVRFLKQGPGDVGWFEIDDAEALSKTSQAFREPEKKRSADEPPSVDVAALGMLQMAKRQRGIAKRKKGDLLGDDLMGAVSTTSVVPAMTMLGTSSFLVHKPPIRRGPVSGGTFISGCHSFPNSSTMPPALREQESRAVSDFMKGVADKPPAVTQRQPRQLSKQESQEILGLMKSISLGQVPITQSTLGNDFLRFMRSVSMGNRSDSKRAAESSSTVSASSQPNQVPSSNGSSVGSPDDSIFGSDQERSDFVGLMKEISTGGSAVANILQNWEDPLVTEQPLQLPKQDSIDLFSRLASLLPPENSSGGTGGGGGHHAPV